MSTFEKLYSINVNENTETKQGLTYLSWAWAWAEFKKQYPEARYEIKKFGTEQKPYLEDKDLGYMVFTSVTVDDLTHEMWLPVMDSSNKAMKSTPYEYKTKKGVFTVASATMFDINKAIMRCLTKNLAMFGLGLYIYAGEDLPEETEEERIKKIEEKKKIEEQKRKHSALLGLFDFAKSKGIESAQIQEYMSTFLNKSKTSELTMEEITELNQYVRDLSNLTKKGGD